MSDALLSRIAGPVGHILHIGAGTGGDIVGYLRAGPHMVSLVEPDPDALARLHRAVEGHRNLQVIEAAISPDPGAGSLRRFSFGDLNALRAPTGLAALFPGLEELASVPVLLRDPVTLVEGLIEGPGEGTAEVAPTHVLVIEAPGEALAIVSALAGAGLLVRFGAVRVQEGRVPLYAGAGQLSQVQTLLREAGFTKGAETDNGDPDRPVFSVLFDKHGPPLSGLQEELDQVRADRDQLEALAGTLKTELRQTRREKGYVKASLTRRETALAAQQRGAEAATARIGTLEQERDGLARELEAYDARVEEIKRETMKEARAAHARELETYDTRIADISTARGILQQERDAGVARLEQLEASLATLEAEREGWIKEQEALKKAGQQLTLSCEDMLRAEGQIEIIKDLLLRGSDL